MYRKQQNLEIKEGAEAEQIEKHCSPEARYVENSEDQVDEY